MTSAEPIEIPAPDGVVLRGLRWPGDADCVILVHDIGEHVDLEDWNALVPFLLGEGVSVFAVDLRGHGASDGEWALELAPADVAALIGFARSEGARCIVVVAAGSSALAVLTAVETTPVDGVALLSVSLTDEDPIPRGAGVPKLLISGVADPEFKSALDCVRTASIGWALAVNLPTTDQGAGLFDGAWASQARDHLLAFIRERRYLSGGERTGLSRLPESYREQIGLRPRGGKP